MKAINLSRGMVALVDDEDFEALSRMRWHARGDRHTFYAGHSKSIGDGKQVTLLMHRVILGISDVSIKVDHKDGNGLNNQRENLRQCSNSQNCANRPRHKDSFSSKFKGVSWHENKWQARIGVNGVLVTLGSFADEVEAAKAYDAAAINHFGAFARVNFKLESE